METYLLEKVIAIVKEASALMVNNDFEIHEKNGFENLVTSSDLAVQQFLTDKLSKLLPGSGFFCEEEDAHDVESYTWIIDPIDGTANYARQIADCCISVGLSYQGSLILGVVYSPGRGKMYYAEKGKGAFMNGKPIHVSDRPFENGMFCTAMSTYHKEYAKVCSDIIYEAYMQCNDLRRFGSAAVELCMMAEGKVELYFEMQLQPWDYAASTLILQEAGGTTMDLEGNQPSLTHSSLFVAANTTENCQRLLSIVRHWV